MADYYDVSTGEEISDSELHDRYDAMLDELGDVIIGGLTYSQSIALKRVDEIAYRCGFSDWASDESAGVVESGYWVRVLTEDGEQHLGFPDEWFTEETDALSAMGDTVEVIREDNDGGVYTVQLFTTSGDVIAEERIDAS